MEPVREDARLAPESPYGLSKLMSEWMLRDAAAAHGFTYTALRYFNVSGADPRGRTGQSTPGATHLIKVACETALGKRASMQIFGTDYPTPDGTCVRDYIHVSDLAAAHRLALKRLRSGAPSLVANCGYSHGYSVREVLSAVTRVHGRISSRNRGGQRRCRCRRRFSPRPGGARLGADDLDKIAPTPSWEDRRRRMSAVCRCPRVVRGVSKHVDMRVAGPVPLAAKTRRCAKKPAC